MPEPPDLPALSVPEIRAWTGDRNYAKGQPYFRGGALRSLRRMGMTLRAGCQGTAPTPYEVEITLDAGGIAVGTCSCPVGYGGHCKHAAALLMAWLQDPEVFEEVVDVAAVLPTLDREQLARVVSQVYARFPQVKVWLDLELTRQAGPPAPQTVAALAALTDERDPKRVVGDVSKALDDARTYHQEAGVLPRGVADVLAAARAATAQGDHARAATLSLAVIEGASDALRRALEDVEDGPEEYGNGYYPYSNYYDEEGGYLDMMEAGRIPILALDEAATSLGACLEHLSDPTQRAAALDAFYALETLGVESYVLENASFPETAYSTLTERTTPDERRGLVERFLADRPKSDWYRREYDALHRALLLALAHGVADDDDYLALCRELGATEPMLDELLRLGRVDEAVAELRALPTPLPFEAVFTRHGLSDRFYLAVRELPDAAGNPLLVRWLRDQAEARGDLEMALLLARRAYDATQAIENYRALRAIAKKLNRWDVLRDAIFRRVRQSGDWAALTELQLEEGEIDDALETVERVSDRADPQYSAALTLRLKVAAAAEAARPEAAIALYTAAAESYVGVRTRQYYGRAAELLTRVRDLYRAHDQGDAWQALIKRFREDYRRLSALQDELAQAKLFAPEPVRTPTHTPPESIPLSLAPQPAAPDHSQQPQPPEPRIHIVQAPGGPYTG